MKSDGILKPLAVVFLAAIALYAVSYTAIEHRRTHKGPWQVQFTCGPSGAPTLVIDQPALAITNVQITFTDERCPADFTAVTIRFRDPQAVPWPVPFGQCLFMDTTFLPGTIVLSLFGHEIQFIPRVLTIDRQEQPWTSHAVIPLTSTNLSSPNAL